MNLSRMLELKILLSVTAIAVPALVFLPAKPAKADYYHEIHISAQSDTAAIQNALNQARDKATSDGPYKIILEGNSYTLSHSLYIYSNTCLDAGKARIRLAQTACRGSSLIKIGTPGVDSQATGFYYRNITIDGGIWDRGGTGGTAIRLAHAENVTLKNAEACNAVNSHLVETAGLDGFTVSNCYFHDSAKTQGSRNGAECIQLDILMERHFHGYKNLGNERDYVSRNITIRNCRFHNVVRTVGSHTGVRGIPYENVKIINNKISGVSEYGLLLINMQNLEIKGNEISSGDDGIQICCIRDSRDGFFLPNDQRKVKKDRQTMAVIENNTIYSKKGNGVNLYGIIFKKDGKGNADIMPAGNYSVRNVRLKNNSIRAGVSGKSSVLVTDGKQIDIAGNQIRAAAGDSYALLVKDGSRKVKITGNTVRANGKAAIRTQSGDGFRKNSVTEIRGNRVQSGSGRNGISLASVNVRRVEKNRIKDCLGYGLFFGTESGTGTVKGNVVSGSEKAAVRIKIDAKVKNLRKNKLKNNWVDMYVINGDKDYRVKNLKVSGIKAKRRQNGIAVTWKGTGAAAYQVYRKKDGGSYRKIATVSGRRYADKKVKKGRRYRYRTTAVRRFEGNATVQKADGKPSSAVKY